MSVPLIFENVFGKLTSSLKEELARYWSSPDLAVSGDITERAKQVAVVARYGEGAIVGVASVEKVYYASFKHDFFLFKASVSRDAGGQLLSSQLLNVTFKLLNDRYNSESETAIGLLAAIQNKHLDRLFFEAIGARSKMIFVGYNQSGHQMRVRYFDHALLNAR